MIQPINFLLTYFQSQNWNRCSLQSYSRCQREDRCSLQSYLRCQRESRCSLQSCLRCQREHRCSLQSCLRCQREYRCSLHDFRSARFDAQVRHFLFQNQAGRGEFFWKIILPATDSSYIPQSAANWVPDRKWFLHHRLQQRYSFLDRADMNNHTLPKEIAFMYIN